MMSFLRYSLLSVRLSARTGSKFSSTSHYFSRQHDDLLSTVESNEQINETFGNVQKKRRKKIDFKSRNSREQIQNRLVEKYDLPQDSEFNRNTSEFNFQEIEIAPETVNENNDDLSKASGSSSVDINDPEKMKQKRFIRELKEKAQGKERLNTRKKEAVVEVPFGYMRLDSMNRNGASINRYLNNTEGLIFRQDKSSRERGEDFVVNHRLKEQPDKIKIKSKHVSEAETYGNNKKFPGNFSADFEPSIERLYVNKSAARKESKTEILNEGGNISLDQANFFDEQYFGSQSNNGTQNSNTVNEDIKMSNEATLSYNSDSVESSSSSKVQEQDLNLFDEQYFGSVGTSSAAAHKTVNESKVINAARLETSEENSFTPVNSEKFNTTSTNIFDEQYFDSVINQNSNSPSSKSVYVAPAGDSLNKARDENNSIDSSRKHSENIGQFKDVSQIESSFGRRARNLGAVEVHEQSANSWEKYKQSRPHADVEDPKTGYDFAMKLRLEKSGRTAEKGLHEDSKDFRHATHDTSRTGVLPRESSWSGKVDSKGFRVLEDQTLDVQSLIQDDLITILKNSIVYQDDNLLVIDKPYGLPSHGGPGVHHSVGKLLDALADRLDHRRSTLSSLHLVHRLDKETTGVMILAKSQQIAELLMAMFKKRQVIKHYWMITKGIPNPQQGVIDIPMGEGVVDGKYCMELRPETSELMKLSQGNRTIPRNAAATGYETHDAVTNYRVLSSNNSAALVECTPETGVRHQIRCHMAFALNTPILGDHKYSHVTRIAPQRLHPEMLRRLGIRQAKVRHVPMHLHAKAVVLPEFREGRNLFLSARLPKHFVQNMKWLQLKPPE